MHLRQRIKAIPSRHQLPTETEQQQAISALMERGWEGLTKQQRRILDEIEQLEA
jgi:hypothetical protein